MKRTLVAVSILGAAASAATMADAHISVAGAPYFANTTHVVKFSVGHGCSDAPVGSNPPVTYDTWKLRIVLPAGVTSVRPVSGFGKITLEKDTATQVVTAINLERPLDDLASADIAYQEVGVRMRLPDAPFATLRFPIYQTCRRADGSTLVSEWIHETEGPGPDGGTLEPAPALRVLPTRKPGWNKYTVPAAISDLSLYFGDAQIVWKGQAAWSPNPETVTQISTTSGVTALASLAANDVVWVKY